MRISDRCVSLALDGTDGGGTSRGRGTEAALYIAFWIRRRGGTPFVGVWGHTPYIMSFPLPNSLTLPESVEPVTPGSVMIEWSSAFIEMPAEDSLSISNFGGISFAPPPCASFVITTSFSLSSLDVSALEDAETITVTSCGSLATVTVPAALNATGVDIQFAQLDDSTVDNILIALAAGTGVDGSVNLTGGSSAPRTLDSDAAYAALIARGWVVELN